MGWEDSVRWGGKLLWGETGSTKTTDGNERYYVKLVKTAHSQGKILQTTVHP